MRVAMSATEEPEDRSLERVLPHFQRQFNNMHECMQEIKKTGQDTYEKVQLTEKASKDCQEEVATMREGLAAGYLGIASNLGATHLTTAPTARRTEETAQVQEEDEDEDWIRARATRF